jgi:tRNA-splicing ligase RtcB (3'-phosphate/5'-hydroxy nucleic acid ligase)
MVSRNDLVRVDQWTYDLPTLLRSDMRVPARLYASESILADALEDRSLDQLLNTTTLPGIVGRSLAMPDMHQGYGFPIGGVAATALPDGVISPGGVGYDINCGVRVLATGLKASAIRPKLDTLLAALFQSVPSGVGSSRDRPLSSKELERLLRQGSRWAVSRGWGRPEDIDHTEDGGTLEGADPAALSERARERGLDQVGTLGSGNHFLEIDEITDIYDDQAAEALGLREGCVAVWIHCGSRGLGHQVCTDAVRTMQKAISHYQIDLPDRELACAPLSSPEGKQYLAAMACAANYAWANRQTITHRVREAFSRTLGGDLAKDDLSLVYDVCHNIAKIETHIVDGEEHQVCVHRKGATRAFGPGYPEVPQSLRHLGQPVLVPGSMGTSSYIMLGTERAMQETFGSCCHGAGRVKSRSQSRRDTRGETLKQQLRDRGIVVLTDSLRGLAEEAPDAYKAVDDVVKVVGGAGLARRVARSIPMGVIKG